MWENLVQGGQITDNNTIRPMRIACWIPKAPNTQAKYVILNVLPLQRWFYESASTSSYTYIACLVIAEYSSRWLNNGLFFYVNIFFNRQKNPLWDFSCPCDINYDYSFPIKSLSRSCSLHSVSCIKLCYVCVQCYNFHGYVVSLWFLPMCTPPCSLLNYPNIIEHKYDNRLTAWNGEAYILLAHCVLCYFWHN
jgi:hypothetical protein